MPRTRKGGNRKKGGAGISSKITGKTQKAKDKEQRINQSWGQSSKDQKDLEERSGGGDSDVLIQATKTLDEVLADKLAAAALAGDVMDLASSDDEEASAALASKKADAKEKAVLDARIKAEINTLSEIESLWKWNSDLARKLSLRTVGFGIASAPSLLGAAYTEAKDKDMFTPADKARTDIQAKKADLIKELEHNANTSTNPRGGRTKKRRYKHPKKGRKSRTHKRR